VTGVVLAFILGSNLHAAEKQPWEWTPAERAQARLDPTKRLEIGAKATSSTATGTPSFTSRRSFSNFSFAPLS